MTLGNTSYESGFGLFNKVHEEEFDVVNHNSLRLFMLNVENKLFNYDELYEYVLSNLANYVFDRQRNAEADADPRIGRRILLDAIAHLREITSEKDSGAGGELGEVLLYLFLEQDLNAPKLFSKVELKTSRMDYVKGSDAIHFKFRTDNNGNRVLQLVIGEAKIKNDLREAIKEAFISVNTYLENNIQDRLLLDTHLLKQVVTEEEGKELKEYILSVPRKKKETIFGMFLGYSIKYLGEDDSNDEYERKIVTENINQVMGYKQYIIDKIREYKISNYEFNFYFLPFHNAMRDRKLIVENLTTAQPVFTWGEIRNG